MLCLKYSNANVTGYPDRLVCCINGKVIWVELKSKGKKPTKLQEIRHQELKRMGHEVWVISTKEMVDRLISLVMDEIARDQEKEFDNFIENLNEVL